MDFPRLAQLVRLYNVFLVSGPIAFTVGVVFLVRWMRARRQPTEGNRKARQTSQLVGALVALVIGLVHFLGIYASLSNALRFRFDPKEVTELRIVRMGGEGTTGPMISRTLSDRSLIEDGLARLVSSECWWRNHEHLEDGYRIQIVIPGSALEHDRYLSLYRRSSRSGSVAVVIPHLGEGHVGTMSNAGTYSCPAFQEWAARVIDPLFAAR